MILANIHDAKTNLSKYLEKVEKGETVTICRNNVPIAEIKSVPQPNTKKRPVGLAKGKIEILPSFFDPLPDEMLKLFYGDSSS